MTIGEIPLKMSVPPHAEDCCVLTPAQQKVVALLSAGATIAAAARAAGVHRNTVTNWRRNPAIHALRREGRISTLNGSSDSNGPPEVGGWRAIPWLCL